MQYFDQQLIFGMIGVDFDPRHLVKRLRGQIIGVKTTVTITRGFHCQHLRILLENIPNVDSLLNVKDKQNVPLAVQLLELLSTISQEGIELMMLDVLKEVKVIAKIAELLLCFFATPKTNLLEQMVGLAQLSFMLLIIYRRNGTSFMTNDLYSDIQSTIQNAYVAAAYYRDLKYQNENDLLIYQLGTDTLENRFCTVRTLTHSNNCNFQELLDRLQSAENIEYIYEKYPDITYKDRLSVRKVRSKTLDYSSVRDWTGIKKLYKSFFNTVDKSVLLF